MDSKKFLPKRLNMSNVFGSRWGLFLVHWWNFCLVRTKKTQEKLKGKIMASQPIYPHVRYIPTTNKAFIAPRDFRPFGVGLGSERMEILAGNGRGKDEDD